MIERNGDRFQVVSLHLDEKISERLENAMQEIFSRLNEDRTTSTLVPKVEKISYYINSDSRLLHGFDLYGPSQELVSTGFLKNVHVATGESKNDIFEIPPHYVKRSAATPREFVEIFIAHMKRHGPAKRKN